MTECVYYGFANHDDEKLKQKDYTMIALATMNRFTKELENLLLDLDPVKIVRKGGAGNKISTLLVEEADIYVMPKGLKFWDVCAPEALLKSRLVPTCDF